MADKKRGNLVKKHLLLVCGLSTAFAVADPTPLRMEEGRDASRGRTWCYVPKVVDVDKCGALGCAALCAGTTGFLGVAGSIGSVLLQNMLYGPGAEVDWSIVSPVLGVSTFVMWLGCGYGWYGLCHGSSCSCLPWPRRS